MKKYFFYDFPIGIIGIVEDQQCICEVYFSRERVEKANAIECRTPLLEEAAKQLKEYFDGRRKEFDLPFSIKGTDFQEKVWNVLLTIPYGQTRSYKEIAEQIGNPKACRAVGMANNKNPLMILVPCHRVVGKDGNLTGYAGGLELKKTLLELEQQSIV